MKKHNNKVLNEILHCLGVHYPKDVEETIDDLVKSYKSRGLHQKVFKFLLSELYEHKYSLAHNAGYHEIMIQPETLSSTLYKDGFMPVPYVD